MLIVLSECYHTWWKIIDNSQCFFHQSKYTKVHLLSAVVALTQPVFVVCFQITVTEIKQKHTATNTEHTNK